MPWGCGGLASPPPEPPGSGAEFSTPPHGAWAVIPCGIAAQRDPPFGFTPCLVHGSCTETHSWSPSERTPRATGGARRPVGLWGRAEPPPRSAPPPSLWGRSIRSLLFLHPAGTSPDFLPPEARRCGGLHCISARPRRLGRQEASGERRCRARGAQNRLVWGAPGGELGAASLGPASPGSPGTQLQGTKHLIGDRASRLEAAPGVPEAPIRNLSREGGLGPGARKSFQA